MEEQSKNALQTAEADDNVTNVESIEIIQNEQPQPSKKEKFIAFCKKAYQTWEYVEQKVIDFFVKMQYPLLLLLVTVAAFYLRAYFFEIETGDYRNFLIHWYTHIQDNGGFLALGQPIPGADYSPAYYYVFALLTYLPLEPLVAIKLTSCVFDVVLAVGVMLCVYELVKSKKIALVAYAVTSFLPTVFLNSGAWAQCDSIYVSFAVLSLYFLMKKKHFTAMILYGVSFAFKLQAIFIAPLLALLWLKRKIPRTSPLVIVGVYVLFCVPMWMMGRDITELLFVYLRQMGQYNDRLTLNAPTFLAFVGNVSKEWIEKLSPAFVVFTIALTAIAMYVCMHTQAEQKQNVIGFALLFALGVPFFLPHMHERYFYLADVLSIVYVAVNRKRWYTAVLTQFCSFYVVSAYLYMPYWLSLAQVALLQGLNLVLLCRDLWKDVEARKQATSLVNKEG